MVSKKPNVKKFTPVTEVKESLEDNISEALNQLGWKQVSLDEQVGDHNNNSYEVRVIASHVRLYLFESLLKCCENDSDIEYMNRVRKRIGKLCKS